MTEAHFLVLLGLALLLLVLQAVLLLRKPKLDIPPELSARLGLLEQASHGLVQSVSRNEGGMERIEQQLRGFTEATAGAMAASKAALGKR